MGIFLCNYFALPISHTYYRVFFLHNKLIVNRRVIMGRQNIAFLYARVSRAPVISRNAETGEYNYGMVYLDTVRSLRSVGDDIKYVRHDHPLVMSREKEILDQMEDWKENDIVFIKGVITSKTVMKSSFCPHCTDGEGNATRNTSKGNLVYITPIYVRKEASYGDDKKAAIEDIVNNREISNQIYVMGTLIRDPKIITTKRGIQITQYPIAINRKFTIRTDDPNIKTDWPIVKSYDEKAREDKIFLRYQAEVIIDGFLQARNITRRTKCEHCNEEYEWTDHCMELVPYDVEYVSGHRSEEEVEAEAQKSVEELKQMLFRPESQDDLDDDLKSDDIKE